MTGKRQYRGNPASLRNLGQFKEMTDEEFAEYVDQKDRGIKKSTAYEERIQKKIEQFGEDYDLDDLKANDKLTLRSLAQAYITLEDYEIWASSVREEGISLDRIVELERLGNVMSKLRSDISSMQTDLNITRKIRKGEREESVISELERLKQKAKEFYQERMAYVFCPKCKMLLFTGWFHYPEEKGNKIQLVCNRNLGDGHTCDHKFTVSTIELLKTRNVNIDDVPEFFK